MCVNVRLRPLTFTGFAATPRVRTLDRLLACDLLLWFVGVVCCTSDQQGAGVTVRASGPEGACQGARRSWMRMIIHFLVSLSLGH